MYERRCRSENRKKNRNRSSQHGAKYWMAMGTMGALLACAPAAGSAATPSRKASMTAVLSSLSRNSMVSIPGLRVHDARMGYRAQVCQFYDERHSWAAALRAVLRGISTRPVPAPTKHFGHSTDAGPTQGIVFERSARPRTSRAA